MELSQRADRLPMTISRTGNRGRTSGSCPTTPAPLPGQVGAERRGRTGTQTPETVPAGTPHNARRLVGATAARRVYATGKGERLRIESADGRLAFSLPTVSDHAHQGTLEGFAAYAKELVAEVEERGDGMPEWSACPPQMWEFEPPARKRFAPSGITPGVMLAWTVAGIAYTGQVWANWVRSGAWNGHRGTSSAVVVATVGGRRARRDEAVCLPLLHGKKHPRAVIATAGGDAAVEVIAWKRADEGLFDMVTTACDPVEGWEAEGGYVPDTGPAAEREEPAAAVEQAPAEASADIPPAVPEGRHCPRCDRNALYGIECSYCGHIIITAWEVKPCHPPAWFEGCCPTCFTADPEVWEISGRLKCAVCADGHSRWGTQVQAGPGWRERSRRVVAWTDNPGEKAYATAYADPARLPALAGMVSPL